MHFLPNEVDEIALGTPIVGKVSKMRGAGSDGDISNIPA